MSNQIHQTPEGRVFIQLGGESLYVQTLKQMYKNEPKKFDQLISQTRS
jgi:tRNA A37 N6-isopentenylltransferase MiaA